jgi:hypothetical protein
VSVDVDGKIVNGVEAKNFIPYQASIRVTIRDQSRFGRGEKFLIKVEAFPKV